MSNNINLLEDKKNRLKGYSSVPRFLRFTAMGLLFIVSSSAIILFILISLSPLPSLKRQEQLALTSLSQYHSDMMKLFLIKERTSAITTILSKRTSYDVSLDEIQSRLPDGVEVQALNIDKNTVSITVASNSLKLIDTFVTNLTEEVNQRKIFSQINLTSLSLEESKGKYLAQITLLTL